MAPDMGSFSARRPRETLGGIHHNTSSNIPLPTSTIKRSNSISNMQQAPHTTHHSRSVSGSRMSLAPNRPSQPNFQRSSSGSNLAEMGYHTVQRTSSSHGLNSGGGRKSYAPVAQTPATQLQFQDSTQRRSSVYSARQSATIGQLGHQSFFNTAPVPAGVPRDPRPLRDKQFQNQIGQELLDYMTQNNFEMDMKYSLTQKSIYSPTQKDFIMMFQWLYNRIDPGYRFQRSIDAEVPPILKQLHYPFEKGITKSQLVAAGAQNWFTLLGMLHWLMQLAKMMDDFSAGSFDDACAEAGFDMTGDRITFDFLSKSYHTWLSLDDESDDKASEMLQPHIDQMAARFEQASSRYQEQVEMLEAEHRALQDQIDELGKSGPRLIELESQIKLLEEDRVKFETWNANTESRVERSEGRVKLLREEIEKTEAELREVETERLELQASVDRQGISIEDIDRMNNERERLQKGLETTRQRLEESKQAASDKENAANQNLEALERTVREYNSAGYRVGIIPSTAVNAKGQNYELSVTVNPGPDFSSSRTQRFDTSEQDRLLANGGGGLQPQHLLSLDMKGHAKNSILVLRKEISSRRSAALERDLENKDILDKVKDAMEDKQQEVDALGHRLRAAEEEFEKTREITNAQKMASDAQIEKLEKELARMRTTMTESVQLMEQREMNTNIEYEQLTLKAAALREELHTEVEKMLNDVIKFKVHVQKSLEDYENFVAEEVEREVMEQDSLEVPDEMEIDDGK